jgi:GT2 family glycosyltransferase
MITIIYSTHKDENYNNKFRQHLLQSVGLKNVQILEYVNHNQYSLSEVYNKGVSESKFDIVVCCHNDIKLESGWGKKLLKDFSNSPEFGVIGKAGSCYFPESGVYWERMSHTMVGHVYHHPEGKNKWINKYSAKLPFLIPVVTIDGLIICFDKTKIKHLFDETIGKFHFYDHLFCLPNYLEGVKIGVTFSFEITHQSVGMPNEEFFQSKEKFLEKWKHVLPLDLKPKQIYVPEIKEKPIKNIGKVAVIIPTKGNVEMLKECVDSFYIHCNPELFNIFIADTGSTNDEKEILKNNIKDYNNITLIEYDYYNFAKINNDVVKNHVTDEYEFLLFCNNDIKLLNNIIYGMLNVYKTTPKVGTIGCRLHFEDNTIQHDGILCLIDKQQNLFISHHGLNSYYNFSNNNKKTLGSTAALLIIKKDVFIKCGFFNENYITCFEDVELNLKCLMLGLDNYCNSNLVSYHYESQTRNNDVDKIKKVNEDYNYRLRPFIINNYDKLKTHIQLIKQ